MQMFVDNKKNKSFIGRRVVSPNNLERECGQDVSGNLIKHPCFNQLRGTDGYRVVGELTNTDFVMKNSFWIGVYPGLTSGMLEYMGRIVTEAVSLF